MLLIWGKKYSHKHLGYVADFCPICREPQAFRLRRTKLVPHFWYIPTGSGVFVCNERRCGVCGVDFNADTTRYQAIARQSGSFAHLKPQPFPTFDDVERNRLQVEAVIRKDPRSLPARDRHVLIRQPLELLSSRVEAHSRATHVDREVGLTFIVAVLAIWAGVALATRFAPDNSDAIVLALLGLSVVAVFVQFLFTGRRYLRREIGPLLVRALKPLKPTRAEVDRAVADMKEARHKIGSKLDVGHLMRQLDAPRA